MNQTAVLLRDADFGQTETEANDSTQHAVTEQPVDVVGPADVVDKDKAPDPVQASGRLGSGAGRGPLRNPTKPGPYEEVETHTVSPAKAPRTLGLAGPASAVPAYFVWNGLRYEVQRVLGHWREHPSWWRPLAHADSGTTADSVETAAPSAGLPQVEVRDRWRVEATPRRPHGIRSHPGVYELVCRDGRWTLDRLWD